MALAYRMHNQAYQYGKHDLERLGLFIEMPYMNGKGYVSPFPKPTIDHGRGIMNEGRKSKNGTQHGYFDHEFRRLYEGECYKRPPVRKDEDEEEEGEKKKKKGRLPTGPFIPPGISKWHSTPGDYYGCFQKNFEAFGREVVDKPPYKRPKPNFLTSPAKKGNTGYANICLSKYHVHMPDPYRVKPKFKQYGSNLGRPINTVHYPQPYFDKNPFFEEKLGRVYIAPKEKPVTVVGDGRWIPVGPTKWQGGCHAGMFEPFPEYLSDRDRKKEKLEKKLKQQQRKEANSEGGIHPQSYARKTMFTASIIQHNLAISVNVNNYKTYEPVFTKRLLPKFEI